MAGDHRPKVLALGYVPLVAFAAFIAVPDATMVLNLLVLPAYLAVVAYALRDGTLPELGWGIAALYAYGIIVSFGFSAVQEPLLDAELYGDVLLAIAVLSIAVLVGTYLTARRREDVGEPLFAR
ncbi:hypothetical protein [Natrinema soli]|uniref:Uncharacterized protein n=1 Tax=Natrinema soli TaxID=1930624 RepID=A0ABD5SHT7_9EURY|nr:hypothetical protein [Natrinema soli]